METVAESDVEATFWRTHAQAICGDAGMGKTLFHIVKAKRYCRRLGSDRFIMLEASIEPLGILSHRGEMSKCGCIVVGDMDMQSLRGDLTANHQKILFDVKNGGVIEAKRWHPIIFPAGMPRLFSLNGDVSDWLSLFGGAHDNARLRRIAIARMKQPLPRTMKLINGFGMKHLNVAEQKTLEKAIEKNKNWW